MAKKTKGKGQQMEELSSRPTYLTTLGGRYPDGRCRSSMDGSVWLYRAVPLAPVIDAKDTASGLAAMEPIFEAYREMAALVSTSSKKRFVAKSSYRRTHALLVNVPRYFHMPWSHPIAGYLNEAHAKEPVDHRLLMFGVQLKDKVGGGGTWPEQVDSIRSFLQDRQIPMGDFDQDFARVDAALARCGLSVPTAEEFKLADAYWNRGDTPATPTLNHLEHIHVFHSPESMRLAEMIGTDNCDGLEAVPNQGAVTFASVTEFDFEFDSPDSGVASWVSKLLDDGALAVSIRGIVEPTKITREELRRQRGRFIKDIEERRKQGKMSRGEQDEMHRDLTMVEDHYSKPGANCTLVDTSAIVAFSGIKDLTQMNVSEQRVKVAPMTLTQPSALAETWLCSNVQANPKLHDVPIQVVAASGITNLSFGGDKTGALFGFTERDRQPSLLSATAASTADGLPILLVAGQTGSGKTMVLLNLADQWSQMGFSGVIVDPKSGSDHSVAVLSRPNGQVIRLDDVLSADGIADPIRFSKTAAVGVELAAAMLMSINPWGSNKEDFEQPLEEALKYGMDRGAKCTGQALAIAQEEIGDRLPKDMVRKVLSSADSSPTVAALVGRDPQSQSLRVAEGTTLIMVGDAQINIPLPGSRPESLGQRAALALIRMLVHGSASALRGRGGGFILLDEAWTFMMEPQEMVRLGRVAREYDVLPGLFTQRVSDAVDAGLTGFISRVAIGAIKDPAEARAACQLAGLDPEKYVDRITRSGTKGGNSQTGETPDWESMRALRDPKTGEVLRGAIFFYKDLHERAIPNEIVLSKDFLAMVSTNPVDKRKRLEQQQAEARGDEAA